MAQRHNTTQQTILDQTTTKRAAERDAEARDTDSLRGAERSTIERDVERVVIDPEADLDEVPVPMDPDTTGGLADRTDPADLDHETDQAGGIGIDGLETGDLSYDQIDVDLGDFRNPTSELEDFLDQGGSVGGLDGRNDAAGGIGSGQGAPGDTGPDLMGGITPGLGGSNAALKGWQQDWLQQMNAKAQDAAANGDEKAVNGIADQVEAALKEWNGGGEKTGGALYNNKIRFDENEGIQGVEPGGDGQVYPPGTPAQNALDQAEQEIQDNSAPSGGSTPNSQPAGPEGEPLPDHVNDPSEGWGDGGDPLDPDDGHTDPVDDGVDATYDGPPPSVEDMVDLTAQYEEGYVGPPEVTGDELDPDGHLDPYFDEIDA